ncbi:hypothetical protein [Streptomyces sp. NPDC005017]
MLGGGRPALRGSLQRPPLDLAETRAFDGKVVPLRRHLTPGGRRDVPG